MGFILEYGHLVVLTVDASLLTANAACRIMETKTSNTAMSIILCYASVCVKQLFTKYSWRTMPLWITDKIKSIT